MATINSLTGSPLIGNPITALVTAASPSGTLSFHRIKMQVIAALTPGDSAYTTIEMSSPVSNGEQISIDISSALRAVADKYVYSYEPTTYPRIKFQLKAWDEYMKDGNVYTTGNTAFPSSDSYYYGIMGKFTDMERLKAGANKKAFDFCRKPTTSPQVVCVGETFAYTNTYSKAGATSFDGYQMDDLPSGPTSTAQTITVAGLQKIGDVNLYALPADTSGNRYQFRFINGLGVLDSFSVYTLRDTTMNIASQFHTIARKETFNSFSRGINRKSQDYETWKMSSGPLNEEWMQWFMHEFLMAEHVWILTDNQWVRCHIMVDESIDGISKADNNLYECSFSVRMDLNGLL